MTDIVERLKSQREVCEHGSQRAKCPYCEVAELEAEIELLRAALQEVDRQLTNMQPHIAQLEEHSGNVGRTQFIDTHVDLALQATRSALEGKVEDKTR